MLLLGLHAAKALVRSAAALRAARQLPGALEAVTGGLDTATVLRRHDSFASNRKDDGQVFWLGRGDLAVPRRGADQLPAVVEVTGKDGAITSLTARHAAVVATGRSGSPGDLRPSVPA